MAIASRLQTVFTPDEVAAALRVPQKTVLRLIERGQLSALKIDDEPQMHYRILWQDLSDYLGERETTLIFGAEDALTVLEGSLAHLEEEELEAVLDRAKAWARAQMPEPELTGRVLTAEEIAERFRR